MNNSTKPNNSLIYSVLFVNSLVVTKSPNHPQLDVFGQVLTCPVLMSAKANNANWSNQWVSLSYLQHFPDWSIEPNTSAVASRVQFKRVLRTVTTIEPFYNLTLVKGYQPTLSHFGESIHDLRGFVKGVYVELLGIAPDSTIVDAMIKTIVTSAIDYSLKELSMSKDKLDEKFKLYDLTIVLLSKYFYSLICKEKDFADYYTPKSYADMTPIEINVVNTIYSMAINLIHQSKSITTLINNYKAYSLVVTP